MKQTKTLRLALSFGAAAMMSVCLSACGSDDPEPAKPATDPKENGEVSFVIDLPAGCGNGTSTSPVVMENGEEVNMAITQKSTYKDPDGTVFTCEPKATIRLSATMDTVVAKDLAALTRVKAGSDVKSSSTGTSPVLNKTEQIFDIGGQKVVFDLGHEVYTYVNSKSRKIEMPYIKANQAKLGNAAATEETLKGRSAVAVTDVTVRPLALSRATTVTDSTMYEVTVRFNLDLQSVNAKENVSQTLEFAVSYIGVVETTTTLYEPVSELTYQWQVFGSGSSSSPFVRQPGRTMQLIMNQTSTYTDEYGNRSTAKPKATVAVSVANDTVWASSPENLKKLTEISGNAPDAQSATQRFGSELQEVTIDWSYESAGQLPYYALEPASLKSVDVKELGEKTVGGKEASLYEITATFAQKATPKNAAKTAEAVEVEYVVSYVGAIEITLTGVRYEPGGEWIDSHDNLALAYYAKVKRIRTYSNGKEYEDVFHDYGHSAAVYASEVTGPGIRVCGVELEYTITTYPPTTYNCTDSTVSCSYKTQFPKMAEFRVTEMPQFPEGDRAFGNVSAYTKSRKAEHADLPVRFESEYPADSRESGWYFDGFTYRHTKYMYWMVGGEDEKYLVSKDACTFIIHDQCLVIDGICIDFKKLHNFNFDWKVDYTDFSEDWGDGTVATYTTTLDYLGKRFVATQIDSLYVEKTALGQRPRRNLEF